jgi:K+-sensing histidine kinase KdpD
LDTNETVSARLQSVTAAFSRALTPRQIGEVVINDCLIAIGAQAGYVCVLNEDHTCLDLLAALGFTDDDHASSKRIPIELKLPVTDALRQRVPICLSTFDDWRREYPELVLVMERHQLPALLAMPLLLDDRALGGLVFAFAAPRRFDADDIAFLAAISQQCAQALERADLYASERNARTIAESVQRWLVFLSEASATLASSLDYEQTISTVLSRAVPSFADIAVCNLLTGESITPIAVATQPHQRETVLELLLRYPVQPTHREGIAAVIHSGQPVLLEKVDASFIANDSVDADQVQLLTELHLTSYLCVPISIKGVSVGALTWAFTDSERHFTRNDLALAEELARRFALAIENERLYNAERLAREAAERAAQHTLHLLTISSALGDALTPKEVAAIVVDPLRDAMQAAAVLLSLVTEDGNALRMLDAVGYGRGAIDAEARLPLDLRSPISDAVRSGEIIMLATRAERDALYPHLAALGGDLGGSAITALPLGTKGRIVGVLGLSFASDRTLTAEELAFLRLLAQQCAQALERTRLYEAEQQARAMAEEAVRLRDAFFSIAAHELRTPLTALLGQIHLLQQRMVRTAESHDPRDLRSLQVINEQVRRLNKMIGTLLDASRLEASALRVEREPIDLVLLIKRIIDEVRPTLSMHSIEVETVASAQVLGDPLRLEQVYQNLISNAVKYSHRGGLIQLRISVEGQEALVAVTDRGIGIAPEAQERIFQRFYRAPNADAERISGMGIGLYVVRELIELHGGRITVSSSEGVGSTFTVYLPLANQN